MSLKARLRLAIALLMSTVVITLSVLYVRVFLESSFDRTLKVAQSITGQVRAATAAELKTRLAASHPGKSVDVEDAKRFWLDTVESDPDIFRTLRGALENWREISEVYIADKGGRILASSNPAHVGKRAAGSVNFAEWKKRSLLGNVRQVFLQKEDTEFVEPLGVDGVPVIATHVVISSLFLRDYIISPGLGDFAWVFASAFIVGLTVAMLLPNVVLHPLERLSQRIDLIATGNAAQDGRTRRRESKEVAAVYSKLNLLSEQYQGAKQNATEMRTNVTRLLQRLENGVLLFGEDGRAMMASNAVGRLLGCNPDAITGRTAEELFPAGSAVGATIADAALQRQPVRDRVVAVQREGDGPEQMLLSAEPLLRDPDGKMIGMLVMLRDAETRGQLEAQLDVAARLSAISQLTRGVAHEIKNPLNAITVHLEVLRNRLDGAVPEVNVIASEISRLDRVVKTFLDFNRPVEPRMRPLDLNELARGIFSLVEPDAAAHGITVKLESARSAVMIQGDRDLLNQAVLNVVMNGIEAMKGGGVLTISTRVIGKQCELCVVDTGPGIPPEIRDKIFNLYFSTKEHGSGIGLAMTFRFVQLQNGKIEFITEPGKGTTFRFVFPEAVLTSAIQDPEISRSHRA